MKKQIGGQRLGAGGAMDVELHNYERSTHNLGQIWRSTMACGTLVPFFKEIALNGDTFDIDLETLVRTVPANGPLFGSFKLQLDVFSCPIRLYNGLLHNNKLGIGMKMDKVKLPIADVAAADINTDLNIPYEWQQFDQSCLWAYLGLRGLGKNVQNKQFVKANVMALLPIAYYDIYKNYYANKQEEIGMIIGPNIQGGTQKPSYIGGTKADGTYIQLTTEEVNRKPLILEKGWKDIKFSLPNGTNVNEFRENWTIRTKENGTQRIIDRFPTTEFNYSSGVTPLTITPVYTQLTITVEEVTDIKVSDGIAITKFELDNIDRLREDILKNTGEAPFKIDRHTYAPYGLICGDAGDKEGYKSYNYSSQNGLALKTYQSDLFNNWLSTEWIDGENGIAAVTAVDTSSGSFTMDALNIAQKVYNMLNRIAVSGGSYDDWQEAVYGENVVRKAETPIYCGGMSTEIIFNEVVSNADTETQAAGDQPLGSLAGKGTQSSQKKGGKITIKVTEPSVIMGIVSITPRIDYSQGNKWIYALETLDDLHKPALDGIGFQDLITNQMHIMENHYDDAGKLTTYSAGKQPAWINYMTNVNECYGGFAHPTKDMFMTLNRRYEIDKFNNRIADLTTYIDPAKYNYVFADQDLTAQNFWVQIGVDCIARRKMSAKVIPNL